MPTDKKRVLITPEPSTLAVFGVDASDPDNLNAYVIAGCLSRYARIVEQAAAELESALTRAEWNLIADTLNGCADLTDFAGSPIPPLTLVVAEVSDGHQLNRAGEKWLLAAKEESLPMTKARKLADDRAADLVRRMSELTPAHGEAILAAVRWFWSHPDDIDHAKDDWWTVEFRRKTLGE
jgi:hypothetical protein